MAENSTGKRFNLKLLAAILLPIILFVALEVALQLIDPDLFVSSEQFSLDQEANYADLYKKDQNLFWRLRSNTRVESRLQPGLFYSTNSHGMRGDEFTQEKDKYRILAMGNSCTFGWRMDDQSTWVKLLEKKLNLAAGKDIFEVINCGIPGYTSHQGKIYLESELLALEPDMILVMYGWNDHWLAMQEIPDAEQKMPPAFIISLRNLVSTTKTFQLIRKLMAGSEQESNWMMFSLAGINRVPLPDFFRNLRTIAKTAQQNGIEPVLLIPPIASMNYFPQDISYFHQLHQRYQDEIQKAGRYEEALVIDLQPEFDKFLDLYDDANDDPIHFNVRGSMIFAEEVARVLAPRLLDSLNTINTTR